jgi:hypothetical protein
MLNGAFREDQLGDRDGIRGQACEHDARGSHRREHGEDADASTRIEFDPAMHVEHLRRSDTLRRRSTGIPALCKEVLSARPCAAAGCGPAARCVMRSQVAMYVLTKGQHAVHKLPTSISLAKSLPPTHYHNGQLCQQRRSLRRPRRLCIAEPKRRREQRSPRSSTSKGGWQQRQTTGYSKCSRCTSIGQLIDQQPRARLQGV